MGFGNFFSRLIRAAVSTVTTAVKKHGGIKGIFSLSLKQFAFSFIASAVLGYAYQKLAGKPKKPDTVTVTDTVNVNDNDII